MTDPAYEDAIVDVADILREAIVAYDFSDDAVEALEFVQSEVEGLISWKLEEDDADA